MEDDSEYDISVSSDDEGESPHGDRLREVVCATLRRHRTGTARINLALVDDACIAQLNAQYLGHEGATDVLAFDLRDASDFGQTDDRRAAANTVLERSPVVDGEIVISMDTAEREAARRGHPYESELALYAVHGTLHLLGYDDQDETAAAQMHAVEDEILMNAGLGAIFRTERS